MAEDVRDTWASVKVDLQRRAIQCVKASISVAALGIVVGLHAVTQWLFGQAVGHQSRVLVWIHSMFSVAFSVVGLVLAVEVVEVFFPLERLMRVIFKSGPPDSPSKEQQPS